jgi:hypothetical protein
MVQNNIIIPDWKVKDSEIYIVQIEACININKVIFFSWCLLICWICVCYWLWNLECMVSMFYTVMEINICGISRHYVYSYFCCQIWVVISAQAPTVLAHLALTSQNLKYSVLRMEWNKVEQNFFFSSLQFIMSFMSAGLCSFFYHLWFTVFPYLVFPSFTLLCLRTFPYSVCIFCLSVYYISIFWFHINVKICTVHMFTCHIIILPAPTSRATHYPPSHRCHYSRSQLNFLCYSICIWNLPSVNLLHLLCPLKRHPWKN